MLVVNRFRVPLEEATRFRLDLESTREALAARPGYLTGHVGRNADEPDLWLLVTRWENVGSYRRALAAYDVTVAGVALLDRAIDEPSAYEIMPPGQGLDDLDRRVVDADHRGQAR